jgi:UDP-N-acetylmuramoylalanine--D-glutamate ligase
VLLGLGSFGGQVAAARFFAGRGARVVITDRKSAGDLDASVAALEGTGCALVLGGHDGADLEGADLVCISPGVPRSAPPRRLVLARGIPWTTEMNLAMTALRARPICVTGSNGKTTTTTLLAEALRAGTKRRVHLGGNMGRPLLPAAMEIAPDDLPVLELSSFQLQDLREGPGARPCLSLVTNVLPNHLDRHGSLQAYAREKRWLVEALAPDGICVLNREDAIVSGFAAATRARVVGFGTDERFRGAGSFCRGGALFYRDGSGAETRFGDAAALRLPGRHNLLNALAVVAACGALGADPAGVARALAAFRGLPDRLEVVAERDGLTFVNDSKATTPEAAACALEAYSGRAIVLAGGASKGVSLAPFARAAAQHARAVLAFGATREELAAGTLAAAQDRGAAGPVVETFADLEAAFSRALALSRPGDVIVLAPGCASYDQYTSYVERGAHFRRLAGGGSVADG